MKKKAAFMGQEARECTHSLIEKKRGGESKEKREKPRNQMDTTRH